jgi:nitric oxide reductase NorE protein
LQKKGFGHEYESAQAGERHGAASGSIEVLAMTVGTGTRRNPLYPRDHVPGEPGVWLLLFGDMSIFAALFGVYSHARSQQPQLFAAAQRDLNSDLGAINTLLLLTSSLLVVWATTCMRRRWRKLGARFLVGAMVLGAAFVGLKAFEYREQIAQGHSPSTNQFFLYYFMLTGIHLAHLIVGLVVLGGLLFLMKRPVSQDVPAVFFEGGACFWHVVDLLWIVIFPLIFLVH